MSRNTIRDVARAAGVAASTVSRVINQSGYVSPETRDRVLQAVSDLDFRPSNAARSLSTGRTGIIALVLPDITNPFFPEIARGVEDAASASGRTVILCNTDGDPAQEAAYLDMLLRQRVDGIVLTTVSRDHRARWVEVARSLPLVLMDRQLKDASADTVLVDNLSGAREATRHLIALGHTRIGLIGGPEHLSTSRDRRRGYRSALTEAGIGLDEALIRVGDFQYGSGQARMKELLRERVTAVFAANDLMAIGAIRAAKDEGRRVPEDVAVVGFDDIALAALVTPPLTTVSQPTYRLGVMAADMLLERMTGEATGEARQAVLRPTLVVRESSGGKERT